MNTRILNRVNAWKIAGKRGIVIKKRKEIVVRDIKDRNVKMNVEINEIEKIEGNLMENFGDKN